MFNLGQYRMRHAVDCGLFFYASLGSVSSLLGNFSVCHATDGHMQFTCSRHNQQGVQRVHQTHAGATITYLNGGGVIPEEVRHPTDRWQ